MGEMITQLNNYYSNFNRQSIMRPKKWDVIYLYGRIFCKNSLLCDVVNTGRKTCVSIYLNLKIYRGHHNHLWRGETGGISFVHNFGDNSEEIDSAGVNDRNSWREEKERQHYVFGVVSVTSSIHGFWFLNRCFSIWGTHLLPFASCPSAWNINSGGTESEKGAHRSKEKCDAEGGKEGSLVDVSVHFIPFQGRTQEGSWGWWELS